MKTSNKILLTTGVSPLLFIFIITVALKIIPLEAKITDATLVEVSHGIS